MSLSCTVAVEVLDPFAVIEVGAAVMIDVAVAAAPAVMANALVVAAVKPPPVNVNTLSLPERSISRPSPTKSATPLAAAFVVVPARVPVPVVNAAVTTVALSEVTVFPKAS